MNYELLEHPNKKIFVIDMRNEAHKYFSEMCIKGIEKSLREKKRIGIVVNKKGYSSGLLCTDCGYIPHCDSCDIPISCQQSPQGEMYGICNICKKHYNLTHTCKKCHGPNLKPYGLGTQKVAEFIKEKFGVQATIIESETVNSPKKISGVYQNLGQSQIMIGTSLMSTHIKEHPYDLVILLQADRGLNIPDFKSQQRNFEFLYDTFSQGSCPVFIVQTFNPEAPSLYHSVRLDVPGFWAKEEQFRLLHTYPPFSELCVIMYKHEVEETLFTKIHKLYHELLFLKEKSGKNIDIYATPPMIYKIFGKFRYNIILKGKDLRPFMDKAFQKLEMFNRGFKIDRNAENIV